MILNKKPFKINKNMKIDFNSNVDDSQIDIEKQFLLAKCFIEGLDHYKPNTQLGLKYLKKNFTI